ncbi:MAG: tripartite tricarboxylate transporter substrate binding protein [Burkholderiales bacterium]|nr:tripartite tricarboxylate transporter substrate binding protein [Burkholderiales bacterium]
MKANRWLYLMLGGMSAAGAGVTGAQAQDRYPSKVVRIVVGYSAGGAVDISSRLVAQLLSESLGQPVIVENRPGNNSILGADFVAKSAPDGYTLGYVSAAHTMNPATRGKSLPYHPLNSFAPISLVAMGAQLLVVNPSLPATNVKELVELARKRPGQMNFASSGFGGPMHLAGELLKSRAGVNIVHVPYKGGGQALNDVISGQVEFCFIGAPVAMPQVRAGRLRLLAVSTPKRMSTLPDVPTVAEQAYPGFDVNASYSMLAPSGTPTAIVNRLSAAIAKAVALPGLREKLLALGVEPVGSTPEQLKAFMQSELDKWTKLVQSLGLSEK